MSAPGHQLFGVASIDAAGTIRLRLVRQCSGSPQLCGELCFDLAHPGYRALLEQIGALAVGEERIIQPEKLA
jgi:hypothetical protein